MLGVRSTAAEPPGTPDGPGGPASARDAVRAVDAELGRFLDAGRHRADSTDPVFARDVADRVAELVLRGGKRLRAAFVWCGWAAAGGSGDVTPVLRTGAAIELVQACALIHDDVMDGSPLRRGAPSVHAGLARAHEAARMTGSPETFGAFGAVLAGDLALAWADDLLMETAIGSPYGHRLAVEWRAMREEMVAGQYRDLHAQATGARELDDALTVATLKSALYTVERPLALGAALAGADGPVVAALRAAGRCAGLAFQLRDDLLGTFGDPALTGKPADDDLRSGKLTCLLAVGAGLAGASGDRESAAALAPAPAGPSDAAVRRARAALERTGARTVVESTIHELASAALRHFDLIGADPLVRREFAALVERAAGVGSRAAGEAA
ncbi:polyprenyl synthetase family protein [Streptomyces sp. NPDC020875]|uniref:polyprenyl synthetase family protein n=1 Tax=Streptomyces sp. NPDC020875 TaxID=3154898 RepID=UPI0033C6C850